MLTPLSLDSIWRDFHGQLYAFIRRRVPDDPTADDLLQDVFLRIHTRIQTLRDDSKLDAWIYQIARNVVTDYYRAQQSPAPLTEELPAREPDVDDLAERLAPSIRQMVLLLPPALREAFLLTEINGMSQVQLAQRLGISVSGAKSRVQRARAQIRQMLLDCCHFEFDRRGGVVNYYPRPDCCRTCECELSKS